MTSYNVFAKKKLETNVILFKLSKFTKKYSIIVNFWQKEHSSIEFL